LEDGDVMTITGYNGDCASTPDVYTFTVNTMNLDLTVAASSMICDGEAVTFTATGADQYEFFLNGVSQGALSATNTYTSSTLSDLDEVTFVGYNNTTTCTQPFEDYILMNVLASPSIAPQSAVDFCEGDSVVLVSNMGYGNQWYVDGNPIPGATDTSYVAYTSGAYSLETTSGGTGDVWSFGQNATGSFGSGNNFNNSEPTVAATTEQFNQLSSGFDFVLGVTNANEVYAWGENSSGQLGDGTYTSSNLPQIVPTLTNVKNVATTESSSMAVTQTGDVYVWGNNSQGQLATGNTSVINFPFLNVSLANTDSIAGGRNHFVILRNDGTVWAVGNNDYGQLGQGNLTGSMSAVQVPGLAGIVSVGAGEYHSFAIDAAGDLYVWGNNGSGQLGLNDLTNRLDPTLSPVKDVINAQGGANHSVFLTSDEEVWASGGNAFGQLGTGNFTNTTVAVEVPVTGADMISAGQYTTLVKRTDMSVFGFGNNVEDQLSSPSGTSINTPEHISDLDGVVFIEASKSSSHFIYGDDQTCTSANVDVNMLTVPAVTITASGDTLSTIAGASYQWYFNGNPIPGATNQTYVANESGDYEVEVTFANGCTGVSPVYYHSMTSIHDLTFGIIEVYPNPANDVLNVKFGNEINETMSITIYDQYGRLVMNREFIGGSKLSIDVSQLVTGVYHMTIAGSDVSGNIRFVKSSN
jgi:alpha-tubulin suppressor-like RCC1 family protein